MTAYPRAHVERVRAASAWSLRRLMHSLNRRHHRKAVMGLMVVVLAHWVEHLVQAFQIWALGWSRPESRGFVGGVWPWLVSSEWLHFGYAIVMLIGLVLLRPGFSGAARSWWNAALGIQIWHFFEHFLLLMQAQAQHPFLSADKPTSVIQLVFPRVELHLFYNAVVFTPMVVAVYLQFRARRRDRAAPGTPPAAVSG